MAKKKDPVEALGRIVIIKEMEQQKKTASGIYIEGMTNKEPFAVGTVISVGKGIHTSTGQTQVPSVKADDIVFYDKGKVARMNGLVYISADHIVAIVNDKSQLPTGYYEIK